jgi:hypothetical protein
VSDLDAFTIYKLTLAPNGTYTKAYFDGEGAVTGVATDGAGNVYFGAGNGGVKVDFAQGGFVSTTTVAPSIYATGIAVDANGDLFIANDSNLNEIVKETPSANGYLQSTVASGLDGPTRVAVDDTGNLYIAGGFGNGYILKESLAGSSYTASTLATGFSNLGSVTVDGSGNVYFTSNSGETVGEINFSSPPALNFVATSIGSTSTDSPQTVTLENVGNATLTFPAPATGNNPSIATSFTFNSSGASACPLVAPGSSTAGTLASGASCQLPISFQPVAVGNLSGSLVITDNHLNAASPAYATQSIALSGTATQATPNIRWAQPAAITYGTSLSGILNASEASSGQSVPGTFAYTATITGGTAAVVTAASVPGAGNYTLNLVFTPTDSTNYTTVTATVNLTVNQVTPTITWATPSAISYGTALGATQLDASSTLLSGTFAYSPVAGTVPGAGPQTLSVTFTPTDTTDYTTATSSVTLTVNKATSTITWATPSAILYGTALGATQLDASSTVAGTFAYSPAAGTVLGVGAQTLSVTFTPTSTTDYTTATSSVALTVNKATPAVMVVSSANPAFISSPVTLTANVTSPAGTPTGTVTFFDGTTQLGSGTLNAGVVTCTTSALVGGSHSITAVYSGDSNFVTLTSAALTETIEDFTLGSSGGGSTTSQTASPGGQAVYTLAIAPAGGSTFGEAITFAVTGLPPGATAVFSPTTIAAGAGATDVTLTVSLPSQSALQPERSPFGGGRLPIALGLILLPFAGRIKRASRRLNRVTRLCVLGLASLALVAGLTACGGKPAQSPESYTLTITATSGSLSHSTTVGLTVQ